MEHSKKQSFNERLANIQCQVQGAGISCTTRTVIPGLHMLAFLAYFFTVLAAGFGFSIWGLLALYTIVYVLLFFQCQLGIRLHRNSVLIERRFLGILYSKKSIAPGQLVLESDLADMQVFDLNDVAGSIVIACFDDWDTDGKNLWLGWQGKEISLDTPAPAAFFRALQTASERVYLGSAVHGLG